MPPKVSPEGDTRLREVRAREGAARESSSAAQPQTPSPQMTTAFPTPPKTPTGARKRARSEISTQSPESPTPKSKRSHIEEDDEEDEWEEDQEEVNGKPFYQDRPQYLKSYEYVQERLWELMGKPMDSSKLHYTSGLIQDFAEKWFDFSTFSESDDAILKRLLEMDSSAALIIGYVADGGPRSISGWLELFTDKLERQSLVSAIIGLVLQEHVFSSLCYGATPQELQALHKDIDLKYRAYPEDGLSRAQRRYDRIKHILADAAEERSNQHGLPKHFVSISQHLAWQLHATLDPIARLAAGSALSPGNRGFHTPQPDPKKSNADIAQQAMVQDLFAIVARAGLLALHMRLDPQTIFLAAPAFKDDFWNEDDMRAYNRRRMVATNPTTRDYGGGAGAEEKRRAARGLLALVRQTVFPGWKAYRRGGWRMVDKEKGIREAELERAWVGLRWGLQRRWESEVETAEREKEEERRTDAAAKKKKGKAGRAAASSAAVITGGDSYADVGFKEWLTIWAEGNEERQKLEQVRRWFDFNEPGEEFVSDGDE